MTFIMGENKTKIDLALTKKSTGGFYKSVKAIPWAVSTCVSGSRYR